MRHHHQEDEIAAHSVMAFAGLDGPLPSSAAEWDTMLRRCAVLRRRVNRLHLQLATGRPKHFPL